MIWPGTTPEQWLQPWARLTSVSYATKSNVLPTASERLHVATSRVASNRILRLRQKIEGMVVAYQDHRSSERMSVCVVSGPESGQAEHGHDAACRLCALNSAVEISFAAAQKRKCALVSTNAATRPHIGLSSTLCLPPKS